MEIDTSKRTQAVTPNIMLPFLLTVAGVSMSGVMMPGPVFAVTIAKSDRTPFAGALVAVGHGVVEVPLMLLIYFGVISIIQIEAVKLGVGIAGGLVLIFMGVMGFRALKARTEAAEGGDRFPVNPVVAGMVTTILNPYFLIWWAFVGAALLAESVAFGWVGLASFIPVHLLCDVAWLSFVGFMVYKTGRLWGRKVHNIILTISALLLVGFGAYFLISAVVEMV